MKLFSITIVILFSYFTNIDGLKVLGILPFMSKSHWYIGHGIIKALVDAGHEATVLSTYPLEKPIANYEVIDISDVRRVYQRDEATDPFKLTKLPMILTVPFLQSIGNKVTEDVLKHPNVQLLMQRREKFDVCFLETFHANALSGIFEHFDCAFIPYSSATVSQWVDVMTSNISPSSYVSSAVLPYAGKLNFMKRFWNIIYEHVESLVYYAYHLPIQRSLYEKYFPNATKTLDEMISSPAMVFMSNHYSIDGARPYLPNMIEISGIHISPSKPLPKDIQKYLDSATDGAVLFSMGSIVKAKEFPVDKREAFVKAFAKINMKVLWKYENETLPNKPENVMISPWIPQRDILAHPNIRLFISHGGYLGTSEAAAEGVPMLGIPMYGDQPRNIANMVYQERGLLLNIEDINESNVSRLLNELLKNPKYYENAKIISRRYNDRAMTPQQQVVFWSEYAARHNGASFLRSAGSDLNALEFYQIDVSLAILAVVILAYYAIDKSFKLMSICIKKQKTE